MLATFVGIAQAAAPGPVDFATTATDGRPLRLSDYRGRWLLVNYWATWCGPCIAEIPVLSRWVEREPRFAVVGLTDEKLPVDALKAFLAAHPPAYAVAMVEASELPAQLPPKAFGVGMRPISYLLAPDGRVVERFVGGVEWKQIERHLGASR